MGHPACHRFGCGASATVCCIQPRLQRCHHNGSLRADRNRSLVSPSGHRATEYGVNDARVRPTRKRPQVVVEEFKSNLREYHRYYSGHQSPLVLVAAHYPEADRRKHMPPQQMYIPGNGKAYAENYVPYHRAVLEVGDELGVPVLDIPAELEWRGWTIDGRLMEDGLHLNAEGHRTYAELLIAPLRRILDSLYHSKK